MRKGQAAIEYLTTYGWAILVLLLMVSALSLFGVIDIRDWAPDRCEVGSEFFCKDYVFINDGNTVTLRMIILNNLQERILIKSISCSFENVDETNVLLDLSVGNDGEQEITCETSDSHVLGMKGKIKADYTITYQKRDGQFDHDVKGSAFGEVITP